MPGNIHPIRVPICRCILTETLVARLRDHPEGTQLAAYLEGPSLDGQPRPVVGSDLSPISPSGCTDDRKKAACIPGFIDILTDSGLDTTIPAEPPLPG